MDAVNQNNTPEVQKKKTWQKPDFQILDTANINTGISAGIEGDPTPANNNNNGNYQSS